MGKIISLRLRRLKWSVPFLMVLSVATTTAAATVINVQGYGAIPNDSVDDTLAIQRAIDAAPNGSIIYFPRGTYRAAGLRIHNRTDLTLTGDGSTTTVLKRNGAYPKIVESSGSTDIRVTQLGFDANGVTAFGGFNFYDAKRITITKTHFFDSAQQPVGRSDRYSWVFGRGSVPSEDILIRDNLVQDLQVEVDFAHRVRIEGNTVVRPVRTAGIGVFTITHRTSAQEYTIRRNTIVDPVVSAGGIVVHLDPPSTNHSRMKTFRILENQIVYTRFISSNHAAAIRLGTGDNSQATAGNLFDDIVIQNNVIYKDPGSAYDFGNVHAVIFGNSSAAANFRFDNTNVSHNRVHYNNTRGLRIVDIRQKGINYVESNNLTYPVGPDRMPPSVPTGVTSTCASDTEIHLAWNPSFDNIGVSRYRIYRNGSARTYADRTSYLDNMLIPGSVYTYTITALDAAGNESAHSFAAQCTTPAPPPPNPPGALTVVR